MSEYLHLRVITQILRRLPVKSVAKCTSVCKTWYALIKDPYFISTHLQAASLQDNLLLQRSTTHYYLRRDNDDFEEYKQLILPFYCGKYGSFTFVGTCNGLICLTVEGHSWDLILWNPSIHKHCILPKPDLPSKRFFHSTLGFGFDAMSEDYKVIIIASLTDDLEVWLFSLNKCSWSRLTEFSPKHFCSALKQAVFVNGALHWGGVLSYGVIRNAIMAFDLSTEKFYVMNYPTALVFFDPQISLIKYEDSIAVVTPNNFNYNQVQCWVMKEYNIDSSWVNVLCQFKEDGELVFGTLMDVFMVRKNGEVLVNVGGEHGFGCELATLNFTQREQQLKRLGIWIHHTDSSVGSFVESLVLFDKGEQDPEGKLEGKCNAIGQYGRTHYMSHDGSDDDDDDGDDSDDDDDYDDGNDVLFINHNSPSPTAKVDKTSNIYA